MSSPVANSRRLCTATGAQRRFRRIMFRGCQGARAHGAEGVAMPLLPRHMAGVRHRARR